MGQNSSFVGNRVVKVHTTDSDWTKKKREPRGFGYLGTWSLGGWLLGHVVSPRGIIAIGHSQRKKRICNVALFAFSCIALHYSIGSSLVFMPLCVLWIDWLVGWLVDAELGHDRRRNCSFFYSFLRLEGKGVADWGTGRKKKPRARM